MILPGATLGMLGGGQLGRMFTVAARTLGYRVIVLDPDPDSPAGRIADEHLHSAYTDEWALGQLAKSCAAVTTEFENIPAATLLWLQRHLPVRPSSDALVVTQNRILEKDFLARKGFPTVAYRPVETLGTVDDAVSAMQGALVLKRAALGYDGKGQALVGDQESARAAFVAMGSAPCVLEQKVDLHQEISVVVARAPNGESVCYPVAENSHENGILAVSSVPANVEPEVAQKAREMATAVAEALNYCGVLAVEFFITMGGKLLINEIAPRPHNSGHFTLDACVTSQFEQQVRVVCGLPAGETRLLSPIVMVNLLGDLWNGGAPKWERLLSRPNVKLHLYGKRTARPGRKMGHFCVLDQDLEAAKSTAESLISSLAGG